ncbi:MAG: hypothetical protein QOF69_3534 [Solirubrobacteraceae bacterium]|jgi:hypothetical protein|nr:hypothetical protein [Solirubrobacteraceae bacterium]
MPDQEGKTSGPGVKDTPDNAYKSGRLEDVEEGSLGAATGGADVQKSRLPEGADEKGSFQSGGFGGQDADDSPDTGTVGSTAGEGDPSPHGTPETPKAEEGSGDPLRDVGDGAKDLAQGERGDDPNIGERGISQLSDGTDAADTDSKQDHPKTPSDMGNR